MSNEINVVEQELEYDQEELVTGIVKDPSRAYKDGMNLPHYSCEEDRYSSGSF
jgi:hypothetical protein